MVKDLSAFATPALDIRLRPGREVKVQPQIGRAHV